MAGSSDYVDRFEKLSIGLKEIVSQAEGEIGDLRTDYAKRGDEIASLKKELAELKQAKVEAGAANPLLLCLIDGDGCIFSERLLKAGTEGGREAAGGLRRHIASHYGSNTDILVHVFFNREGLGSTIKKYLGIPTTAFNAFISGFNTASPLMSMLDVGMGKEAADAKIRELMRIFVRYPHVKKIYFGGGHDNGYTTNLTTLQNEGYLGKIVLLQGYTQLATEIEALDLPRLENNGLFLSEKLSSKTATATETIQAPAMNRSRNNTRSPAPPPPPVPPKSPKIPIPHGKNSKVNVALLKGLKPRACNLYYLTKKGCNISECPYSHEYELAPEVLADFRDLVKQNPCLLKNKGMECRDPECPSAHKCPQGPGCSWYKQGNCKFVGEGMHDPSSSSEDDDDDRILVTRHPPSVHVRKGSSSSSAIDFLDYPSGVTASPSKKPSSSKPRMTPVGNNRTQLKNAFKNSVNGMTSKERLQQMGVGSTGNLIWDDGSSDETGLRPYSRTPSAYLTPTTRVVSSLNNGSPNKHGPGMNGHRVETGIY